MEYLASKGPTMHKPLHYNVESVGFLVVILRSLLHPMNKETSNHKPGCRPEFVDKRMNNLLLL